MKEKLGQLNVFLENKSKATPTRNELREQLMQIGSFFFVPKMENNLIGYMSKGKGLVGVDGSYMTIGNTFPQQIFMAQALAKCTQPAEEEMLETYLETGFNFVESGEKNPAETFLIKQREKVTAMEVKAARRALDYHDPFITMFDGGFWRLSKEAPVEWEDFRATTLEKETLCVGIIEDIGSYDLYNKLNETSKEEIQFLLDSDLLFNLLDVGEVFLLKNLYMDKFVRAFARFSNDPQPIACDFLPEQRLSIKQMLSLVATLTPVEGRGIPLWIDIVDKEVKLTEDITKMLIETQIDTTYVERYFTGKRNRR